MDLEKVDFHFGVIGERLYGVLSGLLKVRAWCLEASETLRYESEGKI